MVAMAKPAAPTAPMAIHITTGVFSSLFGVSVCVLVVVVVSVIELSVVVVASPSTSDVQPSKMVLGHSVEVDTALATVVFLSTTGTVDVVAACFSVVVEDEVVVSVSVWVSLTGAAVVVFS